MMEVSSIAIEGPASAVGVAGESTYSVVLPDAGGSRSKTMESSAMDGMQKLDGPNRTEQMKLIGK